MFVINDDLTIECTRGDHVLFHVSALIDGNPYTFDMGDVIRFSVFEKKDCSKVVLRKDTEVEVVADYVDIELTSEDTRIGEVISKPTDYWYEVELNPDTQPQTIIGYDKDGAKVFKLYPESEV